jgi:hypothetical protein
MKPFLRRLNLISFIAIILIAIDPVELQPLRDFELETGFVPP